jgi:hypothetical protein
MIVVNRFPPGAEITAALSGADHFKVKVLNTEVRMLLPSALMLYLRILHMVM